MVRRIPPKPSFYGDGAGGQKRRILVDVAFEVIFRFAVCGAIMYLLVMTILQFVKEWQLHLLIPIFSVSLFVIGASTITPAKALRMVSGWSIMRDSPKGG